MKMSHSEYLDIINLPHHQSATRAHMSLYDRAAQFAPFAALTGFDEMVVEEARLTDHEINLSDHAVAEIDRKLAEFSAELAAGEQPRVAVTYFKPDARKAGGAYEVLSGRLKEVDSLGGTLVLYASDDGPEKRRPVTKIAINRVLDIALASE